MHNLSGKLLISCDFIHRFIRLTIFLFTTSINTEMLSERANFIHIFTFFIPVTLIMFCKCNSVYRWIIISSFWCSILLYFFSTSISWRIVRRTRRKSLYPLPSFFNLGGLDQRVWLADFAISMYVRRRLSGKQNIKSQPKNSDSFAYFFLRILILPFVIFFLFLFANK